jgi:hypothetical protein
MNDDLPEWLVRQPDPSDAEGYRCWLKLKERLEEADRQLKNGEYTDYDDEYLKRRFDELKERARKAIARRASKRHDARTND